MTMKGRSALVALAVTAAGLSGAAGGFEAMETGRVEGTERGIYLNGRQISGPVILSENKNSKQPRTTGTASADSSFSRHAGQEGGGIPTPDKTGDAVLQSMIMETAGRFQTFEYTDAETGLTVPCNLYLPEGYSKSKKYPMVVFIADASTVGKETGAPLRQGYGGIIWASQSEQAKHECLVLVPEYPGVILDDHDGHVTTDYVPLTERLIRSVIKKYGADADRVYATGQSMGCMTLMVLASKHPGLFAAELFVSGQWDINELDGLKTQTFFYVTAEGDDRASAGQRELMERLRADGMPFSFSSGLNARMSQEEFSKALEAALSEKCAANFLQFRLGTTLPEGMKAGTPEHMFSFDFAYRIDALRDWLFKQTRKNKK